MCKNIEQVSFRTFLLCLIVSLGTMSAWADNLEPQKRIDGRSPANFIPGDDIEPLPLEQTVWINNLLVEDDAGIAVQMKSSLLHWESIEEYRDLWGVASTGLYKTPDINAKKGYLDRNLLKYIDKRVSGEIRKAPKGSTLHTVKSVQKALKPQAEVRLAPSVKIKFKMRVIEGRGIMKVVNPYVHYEAVVKFDGRVAMQMSKGFDNFGLDAQLNYNVSEGQYTAFLNKRLTTEISSRLSATQNDDRMIFSDHSDNRMELFYKKSF